MWATMETDIYEYTVILDLVMGNYLSFVVNLSVLALKFLLFNDRSPENSYLVTPIT